MSNAEYRTPSFTWHSDRRERWTWRTIGALLVITAGAAFYVGRLSIEAPALTALSVAHQTDAKPEQNAASAGTVAQTPSTSTVTQRQAAVQPEASKAAPEAKDGAKEKPTASLPETASTQPAAAATKETANPSVVLINPKAADKSAGGDAPKPPVSKTAPEAVANAHAKTETHKPADDGAAAAAPAKRQTKEPSLARANVSAPPIRQDARQDPVRQDSAVARRGDAYVPPRIPQAAYPEQGRRYNNTDGYDDRARFGERYPDKRYAEEAPPPRAYEGYDDRRDDPRSFRDFRDPNPREYRRFEGYDDPAYEARRPILRPMYGGGRYD